MPRGYASHDGTGVGVSRRRFIQYAFLQAPLCAWWFGNLQKAFAQSPDHSFLNGGCLVANHLIPGRQLSGVEVGARIAQIAPRLLHCAEGLPTKGSRHHHPAYLRLHPGMGHVDG